MVQLSNNGKVEGNDKDNGSVKSIIIEMPGNAVLYILSNNNQNDRIINTQFIEDMFTYSSNTFFSLENEPCDVKKEDLKSCAITISDIMEEIHPPSVHWTDDESVSQSSESSSDTLSVISVGNKEVAICTSASEG